MNADIALVYRRLLEERCAWQQVLDTRDTGARVLVSHTHVVLVGGLVLSQTGRAYTPVTVKPGNALGMLANASHWPREHAERVAAHRGDGYTAVHYRDVPARRIQEITELLTWVLDL